MGRLARARFSMHWGRASAPWRDNADAEGLLCRAAMGHVFTLALAALMQARGGIGVLGAGACAAFWGAWQRAQLVAAMP